MIELRTEPVVRPVTLFASRRVSECEVVRRCRLLELCLMAGVARRGHGLELAVGSILVTGITIHRGVGASQRKAVVVLLNILDGHAPSPDRVALLAIRAQLALVNVSVTVLAPRSDVRKHRLHVALRARNVLVHAPQRVVGLVVIEFGDGADGLPGLCGVAILTGNIQAAVWATRAGIALSLPARKRTSKEY